MLKKLFYTTVILGFIVLGCCAGCLHYLVVINPGPEIEPDNIRRILGKESHVYFADGTNKLGVFFDEAHRQYVEYSSIPSDFVNALVAAEDDKFFSHLGFDPMGIARAAIINIKAGRVVQGGSTITQQTAKNLFKRKDRSIKAKLKELLFALRLEHRYSKEKIFEFYANQFYVSGNGHGLGVAARYYFNKLPQDLTLLECAFIAGSVKRPNAYNPFIKKSEEAVNEAKQLAQIRANYVLRNMYELEMIGLGKYQETLKNQINFSQGAVGFALDYAMEMVKEAVETPEVLAALDSKGIEDVATSGIRIISTVDKELQETALFNLRSELSRLDIRLRGYVREDVQKELIKLEYGGDSKVRKGAFLFGVVETVNRDKKNVDIVVDFGGKKGKGHINKDGLKVAADAYAKWEGNRWSKVEERHYSELLEQIGFGDRIWVSVISVEKGKEPVLKLEKFPQVQGGVLVLHDGRIEAVAGGVENRFFNRAIYAKRTMGSSFKPFLYTAALQLGWNSADILPNRRMLFTFQNQAYFPRPDHTPKSEAVSMSWAGVKSENIASIWLTSHLCDKLGIEELREVAEYFGMAPKTMGENTESYQVYKSRIRDEFGIVASKNVLKKTAFQNAVKELEIDFVFEGLGDEFHELENLHYGLGFDGFRDAVKGALEEDKKKKKLKPYEIEELKLRQKILKNDYLTLAVLRRELDDYRSNMVRSQSFFFDEVDELGAKEDLLGNGDEPEAALYYDFSTESYVYDRFEEDVPDQLRLIHPANLSNFLRRFSQLEQVEFWNSVRLGSKIGVTAFDLLQEQVAKEYEKLRKSKPYSFEILSQIEDFRTLVGLHYLLGLAREFGIESKLEPVLSFALGSNVVSLYETVCMYEGIATGSVTETGRVSQGNEKAVLSIIDRIETGDGKLVYKPKRTKKRVVESKVALAVGHIMENTVKFGTGRYADSNVQLPALEQGGGAEGLDVIRVPLLGKTGTANRYTNASFYGYLPGPPASGNGLSMDNGYAIGVYVGYDNNLPMKQGNTRITGAGGALPTWTALVNTIIKNNDYQKGLDPLDLAFTGLLVNRKNEGQQYVQVDTETGGVPLYPVTFLHETSRYTPSILTFGVVGENEELVKARFFAPFWNNFEEQ